MNQRCQEHEVIACPVCNHTPMPLTWLIAAAHDLSKQCLARKRFEHVRLPDTFLDFDRVQILTTTVQTLKNMRQGIEMYATDKYDGCCGQLEAGWQEDFLRRDSHHD